MIFNRIIEVFIRVANCIRTFGIIVRILLYKNTIFDNIVRRQILQVKPNSDGGLLCFHENESGLERSEYQDRNMSLAYCFQRWCSVIHDGHSYIKQT